MRGDFLSQPKVCSFACSSYDYQLVKKTLKQVLNSIGVLELVNPGDVLLVKPNLLSPHQPEKAITTHPVILEALIELLQKEDLIIKVGESSGIMLSGSSLTDDAFVATGIKEVCDKYQVELINFDKTEVKESAKGKLTGERFFLPKPLLEADIIISLPKLKTHNLTLFTGAIKNLYGCIPGFRKAEYHKLYPNPVDFAELIVDLYHTIAPDLAIMDGVIALEGDGPGSSGNSCEVGTILGSRDLVALDAVAASYLGYKSDDIPITKIASQEGYGQSDLAAIEVLGDYTPRDREYDLPSNFLMSFLPSFLLRPLASRLMLAPEINQDKCIKCRRCLENCPKEVILEKNNQLKIKQDECIKCLCCQELCPEDAVFVKETLLVRIINYFRK